MAFFHEIGGQKNYSTQYLTFIAAYLMNYLTACLDLQVENPIEI
jgi:hypothetical protein